MRMLADEFGMTSMRVDRSTGSTVAQHAELRMTWGSWAWKSDLLCLGERDKVLTDARQTHDSMDPHTIL